MWEDDAEVGPAPSARRWSDILLPVTAVILIAGWTGFYLAPRLGEMTGSASGDPFAWSSWLIEWSVPVLLVIAVLLLITRSPRREAARFGDIALSMREEGALLERRLATMNNELSLAREFLAAQSRDLDSLGRVAGERLSAHADRLSGLINDNGRQVEEIAGVSRTALDNMENLRGQLPVIANSARDVVNNIGSAGRTAQTHLNELVAGFERLNELGSSSERQVALVSGQIDNAIGNFQHQAGQLHEIATQRFAALGNDSEEFRQRLDAQQANALAAIREHATTLHGELNAAHEALTSQQAEALEALDRRLAALRDESGAMAISIARTGDETTASWRAELIAIDNYANALWTELSRVAGRHLETFGRQRQDAETALATLSEALVSHSDSAEARLADHQHRQLLNARALAAEIEQIAARLETFTGQLDEVNRTGGATGETIERAMGELTQQLVASRIALATTEQQVAGLTDGSVRLLELISASSKHTSEALPRAFAGTEDRLSQIESRVDGINAELARASGSGGSLADRVAATRETLGATIAELSDAHEALAAQAGDQQARLSGLNDTLASARREAEALAERSAGALRNAIEHLATATRESAASAALQGEETIHALAHRIGNASADAVDRAMAGRADDIIARLNAAIAAAATQSHESTATLRGQLEQVDELTSHLERRIAEARNRAEEQSEHGFARRAALITETLNATSIDLTKTFSQEISDTAWTAYLKGDRSIFTRRTVRLLDGSEAKEIARLYAIDDDFREYVSRYVHDFEALLRNLLVTQDGNTLAVTLLSSDMGKLYVALAQGIERLRK